MVAVFVSVPNQHAGNPMSVEQALQRLEMFADVPGFDKILRLDGGMSLRFGAWLMLFSGFKSGGVDAFVEVGSASYRRIPAEYWTRLEFAEGQHELLANMPGAVGLEPSFVGCPIVLWEDGVDGLLEVMGRMAQAIREDKPKAAAAVSYPDTGQDFFDMPFDTSSRWDDLVAWYKTYASNAPPEGYTREEDVAAGRAIGISRDRIRDLRNEHKPATWSNGGRPKTKN